MLGEVLSSHCWINSALLVEFEDIRGMESLSCGGTYLPCFCLLLHRPICEWICLHRAINVARIWKVDLLYWCMSKLLCLRVTGEIMAWLSLTCHELVPDILYWKLITL